MSVAVAAMMIAAVVSILIGVTTSASMLILTAQRTERGPDQVKFWGFTAWTIGVGVTLILAPDNWFGPSWSYFREIPHNGSPMGAVCLVLGLAQAFTIWRDGPSADKWLSILFFLNGFVYWTAGIMIVAEGLLGHRGLMEAPFMMTVGGILFSQSSTLSVNYRHPRSGPK